MITDQDWDMGEIIGRGWYPTMARDSFKPRIGIHLWNRLIDETGFDGGPLEPIMDFIVNTIREEQYDALGDKSRR